MSAPPGVWAVMSALLSALLALLFGAASASAATDHVVVTGGAVVAPGQTAGDVVVVDGAVRIGGPGRGERGSERRARRGRRRLDQRARPRQRGASIGWGIALAIGLPLLAILALITLVGIPFG